MKNLLDTHVLIWAFYESSKIPSPAKRAIISGNNYVSIASLWEMAIKSSLGKLSLSQSIMEIAERCKLSGITLVGIKPEHCHALAKLPFIHKDPFDRIIIAQAMEEGLTILTADAFIPQYGVETIWS